ncbi:MAG: heterodisulfide reductase-related iron-sulfur binding cluster [Pseudomonadota bacterium]
MSGFEPEKTMRGILDACADCDTCRFLMEKSCLFFPGLYRLYDMEKDSGKPIESGELQNLADLCSLCGLCPCPNIRADVIRAKTERVQKEGMPLQIRLQTDVQCFGQWGGLVPGLVNGAFSFAPFRRMIGKIAGIHPHRNLPRMDRESFFAWAHTNGLDREPGCSPKVAYFAGCTAGYLFPGVARAAVGILQHNGISVYVPPQQCCGMPTLLEGDRPTTLERVQFNLEVLLKALRAGYILVCSCPTCGFLMKMLLREGACYSEAYQRSVHACADEMRIPGRESGNRGFVLKKSVYKSILKDDGYFSGMDPLERISLSENILDMGEYLGRLHRDERLNIRFGNLPGRMIYYAPCHQREQGIGSPYLELLTLIPGFSVESVGSTMDCCGMGGSLGFKEKYYETSVRLATPLIKKIQAAEPEAIITDCLSCRMQFQHLLPYPVYHPVEIFERAYGITI